MHGPDDKILREIRPYRIGRIAETCIPVIGTRHAAAALDAAIPKRLVADDDFLSAIASAEPVDAIFRFGRASFVHGAKNRERTYLPSCKIIVDGNPLVVRQAAAALLVPVHQRPIRHMDNAATVAAAHPYGAAMLVRCRCITTESHKPCEALPRNVYESIVVHVRTHLSETMISSAFFSKKSNQISLPE